MGRQVAQRFYDSDQLTLVVIDRPCVESEIETFAKPGHDAPILGREAPRIDLCVGPGSIESLGILGSVLHHEIGEARPLLIIERFPVVRGADDLFSQYTGQTLASLIPDQYPALAIEDKCGHRQVFHEPGREEIVLFVRGAGLFRRYTG
jgi:hypothetical protein